MDLSVSYNYYCKMVAYDSKQYEDEENNDEDEDVLVF